GRGSAVRIRIGDRASKYMIVATARIACPHARCRCVTGTAVALRHRARDASSMERVPAGRIRFRRHGAIGTTRFTRAACVASRKGGARRERNDWTGGLCAHGWSPDGVKTITCKNTPIDPAVDLARVTGRDAFVCSHSVRHRDPGNDMANVQLDRLRKVYPNGHVAVDAATLDIADGELLVLVGPSGCGKSTLLRMIAGLESISAGTLRIG